MLEAWTHYSHRKLSTLQRNSNAQAHSYLIVEDRGNHETTSAHLGKSPKKKGINISLYLLQVSVTRLKINQSDSHDLMI